MGPLRAIVLCVALSCATRPLEAACVDWKAMGRFADIDAAAVVFEGVAVSLEEDSTSECAPDRLSFRVSRVWKGPARTDYVVLQDARRVIKTVLPDGRHQIGGCPHWAEASTLEVGKSYIVFASGPLSNLRSFWCGVSAAPTEQNRKRLDDWVKRGQASGKRK